MLGIISVVTCLAKGTQVFWFAVLRCVVEVCNSEHHLHLLSCFLVHKVGMILLSAELAAIVGTFKNCGSYVFPILGVSLFVFWFDRHVIYGILFAKLAPARRGCGTECMTNY